MDSLGIITAAISTELKRQNKQWGDQSHHPDIHPFSPHPHLRGITSRVICETARTLGVLSWADIIVEEVAEALDEARAHNNQALAEELIQVAAVAINWAHAVVSREAGK